MTTGYTIEIGYMSGYSSSISPETAWEALKAAALKVASNPVKIYTEAIAFEAPTYDTEGDFSLMDVCNTFNLDKFNGGPMEIIEGDQPRVFLMASGQRTLKEHTRRAFCRLVIYEMHRQDIEVSLTVS